MNGHEMLEYLQMCTEDERDQMIGFLWWGWKDIVRELENASYPKHAVRELLKDKPLMTALMEEALNKADHNPDGGSENACDVNKAIREVLDEYFAELDDALDDEDDEGDDEDYEDDYDLDFDDDGVEDDDDLGDSI